MCALRRLRFADKLTLRVEVWAQTHNPGTLVGYRIFRLKHPTSVPWRPPGSPSSPSSRLARPRSQRAHTPLGMVCTILVNEAVQTMKAEKEASRIVKAGGAQGAWDIDGSAHSHTVRILNRLCTDPCRHGRGCIFDDCGFYHEGGISMPEVVFPVTRTKYAEMAHAVALEQFKTPLAEAPTPPTPPTRVERLEIKLTIAQQHLMNTEAQAIKMAQVQWCAGDVGVELVADRLVISKDAEDGAASLSVTKALLTRHIAYLEQRALATHLLGFEAWNSERLASLASPKAGGR